MNQHGHHGRPGSGPTGGLDPDATVTFPVIDPADPAGPAGRAVPGSGTPLHTSPFGMGAVGDDAREQDRFTPNPWRRRVADRLTLAGRRHTRHRTDLAGTGHRPGPHALIFLHRDPDPAHPDPTSGTVKIATRMFLHGDDVTDLHTILTTLHDRAREYHDAGVRHPIAQLVDTAEDMTRSAHYIGLGTSTINPAGPDEPGTWPWTGLAHLTDGTRLTCTPPTPSTPPTCSPPTPSTPTTSPPASSTRSTPPAPGAGPAPTSTRPTPTSPPHRTRSTPYTP